MSHSKIDIVPISVMGREFKIKCPKDKIAELKGAADYLDSKMQEVKLGDKHISIDRIAITAALNIAHELILEKQNAETKTTSLGTLGQKVFDLKDKIDKALATAI